MSSPPTKIFVDQRTSPVLDRKPARLMPLPGDTLAAVVKTGSSQREGEAERERAHCFRELWFTTAAAAAAAATPYIVNHTLHKI